ncbi:DUF3549 family protein [Salinimonas sp. HHU 13199]|uniref:DUF3549 family protein n=1 Tax=Salinimonas profundi TaxID=2729140 RepID=A0ABR8LGM4_9ALTE|nr:DUF3549 family protein [Salinimonas profundi]MBD3585404.1 DUF3549 family protein [Salinimonas profundi]
MGAQTIESISEFLLHAGTNFQIVDMGREITAIDAQTFLDIENAVTPVPRPRQQHAWFGIIFWNTQQKQNEYIWFLKLPVDEQGLLVPASRNHFLQIIVDALGTSLTEDSEEKQTLPDNPYNFVPNQQQMTLFNAYARQLLDKPLAQGVDDVNRYLSHPAIVDWTQLPVQAIADTALLINQPEKKKAIKACLDMYAEDFQVALLSGCEPVSLDNELIDSLCQVIEAGDAKIKRDQAILRALTTQSETSRIQRMLEGLMNDNASLDIDTLSVIAARHYSQLNDLLIKLFFEQVAKCDEAKGFEGALFKGFFADLVQVPATRERVLGLLRLPDRSAALSRAIGQLFAQTKG